SYRDISRILYREQKIQELGRGLTPEVRRLPSELRQHNSLLTLVLALAISVAHFADFISGEEENLAEAFVGVDFGRQRRGVRNLEGNEAFPLRLKRGDVHDNAATGVRGFSDADSQDLARNLEVFDGTGQGERVGWDDCAIRTNGD